MCLIHHFGGAFKHRPEDLHDGLSSKGADLIKRAFEDVDPSRLVDQHTHIAGIGSGGSGCAVHPKMLSWRRPFHHLKFNVYLSAAGVEDRENADVEVVQRLVRLVENTPDHGKHRLLAFDKNYLQDGTPNLEKTEFYVSNKYVFGLAAQYPHLFIPNISIHPYRRDASERLEHWAAQGARVVKWLPNAMGIDPADERCDAFYQKMKGLDLILLSHGGEEKAVEAKEDQKLGNPLKLRRALDHGVKVIVAHCAGLGANEDLDDPDRKQVSNFDLFLRLMDDKRYEGLVFGDISAMTQFNRSGRPLKTVIEREDLHPRLLNGSDYPLPAINILIRTSELVKQGYISKDERSWLNEIYDYNPLLFDFTLKRTMKSPASGRQLPAKVFMENAALGV